MIFIYISLWVQASSNIDIDSYRHYRNINKLEIESESNLFLLYTEMLFVVDVDSMILLHDIILFFVPICYLHPYSLFILESFIPGCS